MRAQTNKHTYYTYKLKLGNLYFISFFSPLISQLTQVDDGLKQFSTTGLAFSTLTEQ